MLTSSLTALAVLASHGVSTDERLKRLEMLDLTNVRRKLMEPKPEGQGWSEAQALEAEKWYKRYLAVIIRYPNATRHVPNGPIDLFWHQHILDTRAYAKDCQHVLGFFLHHYPYFGLNGDADQRDNSFDETNVLYREMFGEDCRRMSTFHDKTGSLNAGAGCDSNGNTCVDCARDNSAPTDFAGVACHGESCSCGCTNCGRDNTAPAVLTGVACNSGGGTGCSSTNCDGSH